MRTVGAVLIATVLGAGIATAFWHWSDTGKPSPRASLGNEEQPCIAPTSLPHTSSAPDVTRAISPGVHVHGDKADLSLTSVSALTAIQEIGRQAGFDVVPAADLPVQQVTLSIKDAALLDALQLLTSGYDSFVRLAADGRVNGLWIFSAGTTDLLEPLPPSEWVSSAELASHWSQLPTLAQKSHVLDSLVERLGENATGMLMDALSDENASLRLQALDSAVNHGVRLPFDRLSERLVTELDTTVRLRILDALFYPWRQQGVAPATLELALQPALSDPDTAVREHAAELLAELTSR
ncbi:MAG: hypothetical protein H6993_17450 [Pseudomonadales bacterium]|nr:hypothetical protein [Pseudomonadales bacterium]